MCFSARKKLSIELTVRVDVLHTLLAEPHYGVNQDDVGGRPA